MLAARPKWYERLCLSTPAERPYTPDYTHNVGSFEIPHINVRFHYIRDTN